MPSNPPSRYLTTIYHYFFFGGGVGGDSLLLPPPPPTGVHACNRAALIITISCITRCTRGDARSFFCTYKTYLYAQNYFRKNKFKYCFKSYIKLHEYANCNSANYDV